MRAPFALALALTALGCSQRAPPADASGDSVGDSLDRADVAEAALLPDAALDSAPDRALDAPPETAADAGGDAVGDASADASDAPPEDASPGRCGATVRACLCGCGTDGVCQQRCIARSDDCSLCIFEASRRCCPTESMHLEDCLDRNRCADDGCARASCGVELGTYERCFEVRQASVTECADQLRGCLGPDWPRVRCPGMD